MSIKMILSFHHEKLDVNDESKIKSGIGKPGKVKNSIYSYRNHPYILHDCSSFSNSANGTDYLMKKSQQLHYLVMVQIS